MLRDHLRVDERALASTVFPGSATLKTTNGAGATNDFSSFLLQAQSSKAKIVGLANAGGDTSIFRLQPKGSTS